MAMGHTAHHSFTLDIFLFVVVSASLRLIVDQPIGVPVNGIYFVDKLNARYEKLLKEKKKVYKYLTITSRSLGMLLHQVSQQ